MVVDQPVQFRPDGLVTQANHLTVTKFVETVSSQLTRNVKMMTPRTVMGVRASVWCRMAGHVTRTNLCLFALRCVEMASSLLQSSVSSEVISSSGALPTAKQLQAGSVTELSQFQHAVKCVAMV